MKFSFTAKSFGNQKILEPITFDLQKGTVTAIMGPSGSGKTTLLRLIAGLEYDDQKTRAPPCKIGMVFQEPNLLPWLTVLENIELAGPDRGLLKSLGLEKASHLLPNQISLGMARRVAFARAIAFEPDLLLLDEPFASLDYDLAETMKAKLNLLKIEGRIPIVLVTHNMEDAEALNAETFILQGTPSELRSVPKVEIART